jgi:hypothetical protein
VLVSGWYCKERSKSFSSDPLYIDIKHLLTLYYEGQEIKTFSFANTYAAPREDYFGDKKPRLLKETGDRNIASYKELLAEAKKYAQVFLSVLSQ